MADRGASAAVLAELSADSLRIGHLFELVLDSGSVRLTNAFQSVTFDSNVYNATGNQVGFTNLEESGQVEISDVEMKLSGVDQSWISRVLSENYIDRQMKIHVAFFDATWALISDPVLIFDGRADAPRVEIDPANGSSVVALRGTNHWVDFEKPSGRRTNHQEQQVFFPGDNGFEFASTIKADLKWGSS